MKSKAPLAMIEQIVMVLVFALAAVFFIQMFVVAEKISERSMVMGRAVVEAQNIAAELKTEEELDKIAILQKAVKLSQGEWVLYYDADWVILPEENKQMAYYALIKIEDRSEYHWGGKISVYSNREALLFEIPISGQKEGKVAENEGA